jgi:hypothetical protein
VTSPVATEPTSSSLFNPAFCAVLLHSCVRGHYSRVESGLPLVLAYIALPAALHEATRHALPRSISTSMWSWLDDNPLPLVDFPSRAIALRPYISEGVTLGLRHGVLTADGAFLFPGELTRSRSVRPSSDWTNCVKRSEFMGRWFSTAGSDTASIMARWGIRP